MTGSRQILFIQGGGTGAHDEWDDKLVESLRRELGDGHEVRYPRMPGEDDPSYARWSTAIRAEMEDLDDRAIVAGHSVGGTMLIHALGERSPERGLAAIVLIAAPLSVRAAGPATSSSCRATSVPNYRTACRCMCSMDSRTPPPRHRMPTCMPGPYRRRRCTGCPGAITN